MEGSSVFVFRLSEGIIPQYSVFTQTAMDTLERGKGRCRNILEMR